jgi:hypothetical protein
MISVNITFAHFFQNVCLRSHLISYRFSRSETTVGFSDAFSTRPKVFIKHFGENLICSNKQSDVLVIQISGSIALLMKETNNSFFQFYR